MNVNGLRREWKIENGACSIVYCLFTLLAVPSLEAATLTAAGCSQANVQSAVNSAVDGDTILIPDGSCAWDAGISTTKQIAIRAQNFTPTPGGNATRSVILTNNSNTPLFDFTTGNSFHVALSGIRINEGTGTNNALEITGNGSKVALINDMFFEVKQRNGSSQEIAIVDWGARGGVIWNTRFIGLGTGGVAGAGVDGASFVIKDMPRDWYTASTMGTLDTDGTVNLYMEDSSCLNVGQIPDLDNHGRAVFRHNTYDGCSAGTHAFTSAVGGRHIEWYDNVFSVTTELRNHGGRYYWIRGGTVVFTDNVINNSSYPGAYGDTVLFTIGDTTTPGPYPQSRMPGWGHNGTSDVIDPIYSWNNTGARADVFGGFQNGWDSTVLMDREVFFNKGAKPGYTKYPYPHPLRSSPPSTTPSNTFYIRDGGTSTTCTDWANACDTLPATLQRGATYYVADGSYSAYTFDDAASGTLPIVIKKATASDHGTNTGWAAAYGDGHAAWGAITFNTSYWVFDGSVGGGPGTWTTGHGFTFTSTAGTSMNYITAADGVSNLTVRHCAFVQTGNTEAFTSRAIAVYNAGRLNNSLFELNYFNNLGGLPFLLRGGSGNIIQYNWMGDICGMSVADVNQHCEAIVIHDMSDLHFRFNYVGESPSSGGFVKNNSSTADRVRIYGNVFRKGFPINCNSGPCSNWRIFNNSFETISGGPVGGDGTFTGLLYYNNISYNAGFVQGLKGVHDYNWYSGIATNSCTMNEAAHENICNQCAGGCDDITETLNPFVDATGTTPEAFRLSAAISGHAGTDVCALNNDCTGENKFNSDAFGMIRGADGTWDRGAYEYCTSGSCSSTPTLSPCDVNADNAVDVADVQKVVLQAIGASACINDINQDGVCDVIDVQRVVVAALGGVCAAP